MAKTVFALVFTLIASASIPSPVSAALKRGSKPVPVTLGGFSLTPTIGGYLFAGSEQRDATPLYGLKFGYDNIAKTMTGNLGIEGTLNYFSTRSKTDASDATGYLFRLDAIYPLILGAKWMPFLAIGAGGIVIDSVSHADKSPLFNYGAGLKYFFADYLALRADARHLVVYNNFDTRNNFEVGIGISYYFGKERKKKPVPPPDSDQDGVPDNLDKCPNTPNGVKVDRNGCPADSDKDGVFDNLDKCPDTPMGIPVDKDGCPQNGGKNGRDSAASAAAQRPQVALETAARLPAQPVKRLSSAEPPELSLQAVVPASHEPAAQSATPAAETPAAAAPLTAPEPGMTPAPADRISRAVKPIPDKPATLPLQPASAEQPQPSPEKGVASVRQAVGKSVIKELTVEFDCNSSHIKPEFYEKLLELADILKSSADTSARVEGHADSTGKLSYNIKLSKQRAQNIRNSLIKSGVDPSRISAVGFGPSRSIADNDTIEGRQKNRRAVSLVVTLTVYE